MVEIYFTSIQFENILRNTKRFFDAMDNDTSLKPISIEDDETVIKIHSCTNKSFMDEGFFVNLFEK